MSSDEIRKFWLRMRVVDSGCLEWTRGTSAGGYGLIQFSGVMYPAHRLAYSLAHGPIPEGMFVRHKCDNRRCCNPGHLLVGTHEDNMADAIERKRHARGERVAQSKLTAEDVAEVRRLRSEGLSYRQIGKMFGVWDTTVRLIARGETWAHVA